MELYLQMGHGMQTVVKEIVKNKGYGTAIVSPMNILPTSIVGFSQSIKKLGGNILFDPQLYYPNKVQNKLCKYSYWPNDDLRELQRGKCGRVISEISDINYEIGSDQMIIPSMTANDIDYDWNKLQLSYIREANRHAPDLKKMHTVALTSEVLENENLVESIVAYAEAWDVEGIYIVCEHPESYYLIERPLWVTNLMSLVAGLKRQNKKVTVGYASHQLLCLALAHCDAIASGNFLNLRWFKPEHFESDEEPKPSRRAKWYYCPQALSEYKVTFLDIAKKVGLLDKLKPTEQMRNEYSDVLFQAALPSSSSYGEREAFRHYLYCLSAQCEMSQRSTYQETKDAHIMMLETAEQLLDGLGKMGIKGQNRDFSDIIDVNRAAIAAFDQSYGFVMNQQWETL